MAIFRLLPTHRPAVNSIPVAHKQWKSAKLFVQSTVSTSRDTLRLATCSRRTNDLPPQAVAKFAFGKRNSLRNEIRLRRTKFPTGAIWQISFRYVACNVISLMRMTNEHLFRYFANAKLYRYFAEQNYIAILRSKIISLQGKAL